MVELRKAIQTVEQSKAKGFILSSKCRTYSAGLSISYFLCTQMFIRIKLAFSL